jgi:predicted secreted hydrolase
MKPRPITLPDDMSPHDTIIEWWYFNGHLADARGRSYAFMDCLFRANITKVNIPYFKNIFARGRAGRFALFAHSVLVDLRAKTAAKDVQNISVASRDTFKRPLFYANYIDPVSVTGGFLAHEMAETAPGKFHIKTETLDLVMESRRTPMLEGGRGFITVRERESFYYSLTELKTTGMVRVDMTGDGAADAVSKGQWISVTGRSWMDHQWADAAYAKDTWTWFSIQLENGMDIMCVEYDDGKGKNYVVDILDAQGHAAHGVQAIFAPGARTWKSKTTKAEYPLAWTITIPDIVSGKDIILTASASVDDGEIIFGAINYWEGPVVVSAIIGGGTDPAGDKKIKGVGFMELAGYPSDYNYLLLTGQKMNARMQKEIASRIKNIFG